MPPPPGGEGRRTGTQCGANHPVVHACVLYIWCMHGHHSVQHMRMRCTYGGGILCLRLQRCWRDPSTGRMALEQCMRMHVHKVHVNAPLGSLPTALLERHTIGGRGCSCERRILCMRLQWCSGGGSCCRAWGQWCKPPVGCLPLRDGTRGGPPPSPSSAIASTLSM